MNTLREDTTATQEVVGALIFSVLLVTSLSAGYVVIQDQVEAEHAPDATVEQSSIEAESTDQLAIKPLVGDDVDLENAEVRVTFEDRNAPDAVLTDLQDAKDHSKSVQVSDTQTIQTAGDVEPINQTVTYYERNGTVDQLELNTYKWQKEVNVPVRVKKWRVWNVTDTEGPGVEYNYDSVHRTTTEGKPSRFDDGYDDGYLIVWEVEEDYRPKCVATREDRHETCAGSTITRAKSWHTVNETKNVTVEYPEKPGDGWEKVSDEPVGTDTYELKQPAPTYDEKQKEVTVGYKITNTTEEVDRTKTVHVASENAPEADSDDGGMIASIAPIGAAGASGDSDSVWGDYGSGSDWGNFSDDKYATDSQSDDESQSPDGSSGTTDGSANAGADSDTNTDETSDTASNTDDTDASRDSAQAPGDATNSAGESSEAGDTDDIPADQALNSANDNAAFLAGDDVSPEQNTAIGMGGTAGSNAAGTWTQGESVVVQLDRPLLFEGERVTVQIVDRETNSLVMDRTVRIQDTKRFQFGPEGGATVTDETAPDENVTVNGSVGTPNGTLGDLPTINPDSEGASGTPSPDDDGTSVSDPDTGDSPDVGLGDGDGEPKPKTNINCKFNEQTATSGYGCVGDQTAGNDDSRTEGYVKACDGLETNCSPSGSPSPDSGVAGDGGDGDGSINPGFPDVSSDDGGSSGGAGGGSSGGGSSGDSSGGGTVGGGHSSGGNGDSGAIAPGM